MNRRHLAAAALAAAASSALAPAAAPAQEFRNCSSSGRIQGLTAGGVSCATARRTARRVGARNPGRRTITVNRFRCRIANRTSSGRGWSCTRAGGRFVSWVYVTG